MKKNIKVTSDSVDLNGMTLQEAIAELTGISTYYGNEATIDFSRNWEWDVSFCVECTRQETEEEYIMRVYNESVQAENIAAEEARLYKQLKAKFEGK
jgi:hypothetical protein